MYPEHERHPNEEHGPPPCERASAIGITLTAERGFILARPKGATPQELADAIRRHRADLLGYLRTCRVAHWCEEHRVAVSIVDIALKN